MGLSYILLYRHNIKTVKTKHSRCLGDPDSPSRCVSARSWLTSSAPRRTRSSPDPRWSSASGPTQDQQAPGPREQQYFTPDAKMIPIFGKDKIRAFGMAKFLKTHLTNA